MNAYTSPLLLLVQANVEAEHENAFNSWYYHHVPKLLEIPGYLWGRRYVNILGDVKYLALYGIEDASYLGALLGSDVAARDPRANEERAKFDALQGLFDVTSNVYEQISGAHLGGPMLRDDHVVSLVMADCVVPEKEAEFNAWYDHSHVPNLTKVPGYLSGARFRIVEDAALSSRSMGPKYLALYELAGAHCLPAIANPDTMCA